MTDEQEVKLMKMDDSRLLIELAIAFSNTDDSDLGSYHRRNLMSIFADLNCEHIDYLKYDKKERDYKYAKPLQNTECQAESKTGRD